MKNYIPHYSCKIKKKKILVNHVNNYPSNTYLNENVSCATRSQISTELGMHVHQLRHMLAYTKV